MSNAPVSGVDPRTGQALEPTAEVTSAHEVARIAEAALAAEKHLTGIGRERRAELLDRIAARVDEHREELIRTASLETGFAEQKLSGEINRTSYQFRFFADVIREGSYLEATLDSAGDTPMGPRPDLRRLLVSLGPVAVFGASNFPFAFSVLGGDTASALAAGSPVVVKAHGSHPATSLLSYRVLQEGIADSGLEPGTVGIVFGTRAGADLVAHPAVKAVGFTGSLTGGQALIDIVGNRPEPIPFYGELSSLNPVVVTPGAARERGLEIGSGLVASFTIGAGQLCTKPGLVFVPANEDGDALLAGATTSIQNTPAQVLLNGRIFTTYVDETQLLEKRTDVTVTHSETATAEGFHVQPMFFETTVDAVDSELVSEIFGPVTVVVRYSAENTVDEVRRALATLPSSLTATIHHSDDDGPLVGELSELVSERAGRIVFNGFPTGVAVSWAQTHGGPWPSTNSLHTSVGATAIRRFLRPVTYQSAPEAVLPAELRDGFDAIPRRIDGELRPARQS